MDRAIIGANKIIEKKCEDKEKAMATKGCLKEWERDVLPLVSSHIWLNNYGLQKNGISLYQILSLFGFKFTDNFDEALNKRGLLGQVLLPDIKTFNIAGNKDKMYHLEKQLLQAIALFKRRIEWLTTESRRTFGVIEEKSVTIVLNFGSISTQQFNQYMTSLESVLRQQVSQLSKFNLIRACEDMQLYHPECVHVSCETIENAVQWIWNLHHLTPVSSTAVVEAVLKALSDKYNTAVYLYTEGSSVNGGKEILKHKVQEVWKQNSVPVHVVSFNCDCSNTIRFLREFAESTNGRFHAYAVVMDVDTYETQSVGDAEVKGANVILKRKTLGGVPPGAGVRKDVVLIFEEMEEARRCLEQLQQLRGKLPVINASDVSSKGEEAKSTEDSKTREEVGSAKETKITEENYMSSKAWLKRCGLDARGLGWQDIVSNLAFRHTDTVVDLMHPPAIETHRDAIVEQKLINARYCDELFPIVKLKDGEVFHVLVTTDIYRNYEMKVHKVLNKIQQRLDWLKIGSRALFGTLVEEKVYILIDTSASMENSLNFVKEKIYVLMQEQLRHKKKFNIIAFDSKAIAWKDRCVDVSESSLKGAWSWVQSLSCSGSTNTFAAIQMALADQQIEAIYLLTDGRPDQPPSSIICQFKIQNSIPVHAISFNCKDIEANNFLYDLAKTTGGRYHCFSEMESASDQPQAWESMDIKDLKLEISYGLKSLKELSKLKDESSILSLKIGPDQLRKSSNSLRDVEKSTHGSVNKKVSDDTTPEIKNNLKGNRISSKRPSTAPSRFSIQTGSRYTPVPPHGHSSTSWQGVWSKEHGGRPSRSQQASNSTAVSYLGPKRTRYYHTRTSSGRFTPNEWILPETKSLFTKQADRNREIMSGLKSTSLHRIQTSQQSKSSKLPSKTQNLTDQDAGKDLKLSIKQWLAKNNLVAKRLTIQDVLGCNFVSHRAKYVPVLDKYITGKLFNEIMPMAFVSDENKMFFFDSYGINLKEYENKVRIAVDKYREYLNNIVWEALPLTAKKEFNSGEPVSFENNQEKMLQILKETDWPVAEDDISCLLDEIIKGEKYINQSKAIRKATAGGNKNKDKNVPASDSSRASSHRSKSTDSSVTLDLILQSNEENSPRRSRSMSPSSHKIESKNSEKDALPDQEQTTSRSRSTSRSILVDKSPSNSDSNIPKKATSYNKKKLSPKLQSKFSSTSRRRSPETQIARSFSKNSNEAALYAPVHSSQSKNFDEADMHIQKKFYSRPRSNFVSNETVDTEEVSMKRKKHDLLKHIFKERRKLPIWHSKAKEQVRSFQKKHGNIKDKSKIIKKKFIIKPKAFRGQKVIARSDDDGLYYPAIILSCPDPDHCIVHFEYDDMQVLTRSVLPSGGAVSCPPLYVGDYVLVKVIRLDTMLECYVPAIIQFVPRYSDDKFYTVIMYNGQKATTRRRYLIKISMKQFDADCIHISSLQNENIQEPPTIVPRRIRHKNQRERPDDRKKHTRPRSYPGVDVKEVPSRSRPSLIEPNSLDRSQVQEESGKDSSNSSSTNEPDDTNVPGSEKSKPQSTSWLLEQRMSLQKQTPLVKGEHVLARWTDDGWYYKGIVMHYFGNCSYEVKDSSGCTEQIWREDILQEREEPNRSFENNEHVIALHPKYNFSYAPGVVEEIINDKVKVKFYDNQVSSAEQHEVYPIAYQKYKLDVKYITTKEDGLVHSAVVARCDEAGAYFPGTVVAKHGDGKEYNVEWTNGTRSIQQVIHIFGAFSKRPEIRLHSHVLACSYPVLLMFLPGTITNCRPNSFSVKFCDGTIQNNVHPEQCFWLSESYYHEAIQFCKQNSLK